MNTFLYYDLLSVKNTSYFLRQDTIHINRQFYWCVRYLANQLLRLAQPITFDIMTRTYMNYSPS